MQHEYDTLLQDQVYTAWKSDDYTLAHAFLMKDSQQFEPDWHFGFYNKTKDDMVTFVVSRDTIIKEHHTEMAKKDGALILPLDLTKVGISVDQAMTIVDSIIREDKHMGVKTTMFLLQHIPSIGQVWNITVITLTFKTVNIKIDATTGNILSKNSHNLLDMGR